MPAQEDHQRFSDMADELGLEDDDRDGFISSAMKRKGYKETRGWADPDPDPNNGGGNDGGDFFSQRRNQQNSGERTRRVPTGSRGGQQNSGGSQSNNSRDGGGSGWQYGS